MRTPSTSRSVIAFDAAGLGERPSRAVAAGRARQVVRGVYTTDVTRPLDRVVRSHVWEILAHLVPDALVVDRSAGPALFDGDTLFIASSTRARDLLLPGLRVAVRPGHPPFPDDPLWMAGLRRSSIPRALGEGRGWDTARLARFAELAERLGTGELDPDPEELPVLVAAMLREQPFFEAYLSNFIEGTEFTLDEAVAIVYDRKVPPARPAAAHDVTSTYQLISDPNDAAAVPTSGEELVDQLARWHARLMAARPDKRPGQFKVEANRFGSYLFVAPELVTGTLERGFAFRDQLVLPFARAVFMMFLVAEVHPFDDGNGRLARLAMNAELTAVRQHRILVPLIVRNDYLNGLRRLSREGDPRLLVRVLANAWRWSAQVDFSSVEAARPTMERTNALIDPADAERAGKYLILPADIST